MDIIKYNLRYSQRTNTLFLKVCQTSGFRCIFNFRELALEQELTRQNPQPEQARGSHLQWSRPEPVSSTRAGP